MLTDFFSLQILLLYFVHTIFVLTSHRQSTFYWRVFTVTLPFFPFFPGFSIICTKGRNGTSIYPVQRKGNSIWKELSKLEYEKSHLPASISVFEIRTFSWSSYFSGGEREHRAKWEMQKSAGGLRDTLSTPSGF